MGKKEVLNNPIIDESVLIKEESFVRKFVKHKLATTAFLILAVEILIMIVVPIIFKLDPLSIDTACLGTAPGVGGHLLGTDDIGRDVFSRLLHGGKVSLFIGFFSMLVSFVIGIPLGLFAGYFKGKVEYIVMRAVDIFQSFPILIMILVMVSIFGASILGLILMIGILNWVSPAKIIYGATLQVREKDFVMAEKCMGAGHISILFKHILPNVISPVWILVAFRVSQAIIMESSLSFLGAGITAPEASLGNIINAAQNATVLVNQPWLWLPAGLVMFISIICINLVGEGVRDALDPKMKR